MKRAPAAELTNAEIAALSALPSEDSAPCVACQQYHDDERAELNCLRGEVRRLRGQLAGARAGSTATLAAVHGRAALR